ncbi:MAG: choice-of-anchor tandem repeat GloVer-containing protein, partial [Vicinamibacterales bacterium]
MLQRARFVLITLVMLAFASLPGVASAQPIHEFTGADGAAPAGDLVQGRDGLLYGWTSYGGDFSRGTLFRVAADGTGFETLYSFGDGSLPSDGAVPQKGGLLEVAPGLFYGTTFEGGLHGRGALFTLDVSGAVPVVTTLHSFATTEPGPDGGLIRSSADGLLYGTTSGAGWGDFGTIYRVATDGSGFSVLYRFIGVDGEEPTGIIEGSDGWLYGTTRRGGTASAGVVFRAPRDGSGAIEVLAHLEGSPVAGLTEVLAQDGARHLYGVEVGGGVAPFGSIFRLHLDGTGFQRTATFSGGSDGAYPRSRLILGRDGVLYGTASSSGGGCGVDICGSVFRVLPTGEPYTIRAFTLANGASPDGALVQGTDGHLYGTTREGGDVSTSAGVVFVVRDPATMPLRFSGPLTATEGQAVTYDVTLDNTVGVRLPGPFTVNLTVSAGLQFVSASPASDWLCATSAAGLTCQWPLDLEAGAATPINHLTFMPTPPFSTACGIGPSPCMSVRAQLPAAGVSLLVAGTVSPLAAGTPNAGPQPADDVVGVAGQIPATVYVLANDTDPDSDPLTVVNIETPPAAGDAVINPDGSITYQPFETLTQNDSFRYRVSDGRGSTATALVTVEPRVPTLRTSKLVIDVGPLAVGRVAGGRTTAYSDYVLSGRIRLEALTPQELADFLVGTTYDPARTVSDPADFYGQFWGADTIGSMVIIYFRPTVVGRVSVARAVLTTDMPELAPITTSLLIVGVGADPATAPVRATDDTFTIPMNTSTAVDVLANDGTESGGTRPLYVASGGACSSVIGLDPPSGWAPCANGIGGSVTLPPSIQGSQLITVSPPNGATGIATFAYASAELDACFGPPRAEGECQLETTMYFAAVTVNVVPPDKADLGVRLTATPGTVPLGDAVTLRLTVTNAGPDTARAVTLSGLGVLSLSHTIEGVTSSLGSCTLDAAGLVCALGDLAANESATVDVVARATAQVFAGITDPQTGVLLGASVASATDDPAPANNSVFTSYVVRRQQADLGVSLTATPGTVPLGDAVTLRLTVTNAGPDTARAVRLSGLGVLSLSHTIEGVTPSLGSCTLDAAGLVCGLGDLAASQSATVDVVARATAQVFEGITDPQTGVLLGASVASTSTNIPGISVLPATDDPAPTNNSVFTSYIVRRPQADLGVSLTATPGTVPLGDAVTLRLTVTNAGPDTARAVRLSGLGVLSTTHTIEGVTSSLGSCTTDTAGLVCALGDLAANQSATVDVVARATAQVFEGITEPQTGVLLGASVASTSTNIPGISVLPATDDPDPTNNSFSNAYIVRRPQADLGVSLTATPGAVTLGEAVTVRLTVTNGGPDTARAVRLSGLGVLSTTHTIEGVTSSLGSCTTDTAGLVCALGDLAANQSATVDVVARATTQVFEGITGPQTGVLLGASVASTSTNIPGISVLPATDDPDPTNNSFSNA